MKIYWFPLFSPLELKLSHSVRQLVTIKWGAWYKLKCWITVLSPNICQHVHIGIMVYVFMRALFQVISVLGIYLICWTKINASGQAIVPQLGFNRPRWNRTDLRRNQNRNHNGACQVWILGAALYGGKPSERSLITFRWPESSPSEDVNVYCGFCVCVNVQMCPNACSFSYTLNIPLTKTMRWIYNWRNVFVIASSNNTHSHLGGTLHYIFQHFWKDKYFVPKGVTIKKQKECVKVHCVLCMWRHFS